MGKELIIRSNNGVTLTPTGRLMYYYAQSILSQFQVLERLKDVSEEKLYSKLTVSVDSVFLRDDLILQFYKHMKSATTEIHMVETTAEQVLANVSEMKAATFMAAHHFPSLNLLCILTFPHRYPLTKATSSSIRRAKGF